MYSDVQSSYLFSPSQANSRSNMSDNEVPLPPLFSFRFVKSRNLKPLFEKSRTVVMLVSALM